MFVLFLIQKRVWLYRYAHDVPLVTLIIPRFFTPKNFFFVNPGGGKMEFNFF